MERKKSHTIPYDARIVRNATYASVSVAVILIVGKAIAWSITDSVSLQATLIDSLLDAAASVINMLAVRRALRPPNTQYRFGYGKAEAIAALGQSLFIAGSAFWLIYEAANRFIHPQVITDTNIGIAVMLFAMVLTFALLMFQNHVVQKTNSAAIKADSIHYRSDFLINGGVIFVLLASKWFDSLWLDPLCGGAIALYIVYTAWTISAEAMSILMDKELDDDIRDRIIQVANSHKSVDGVHELRTRSSGWKSFIQLHLELDGRMSLNAAHKIADQVEQMIKVEFPNSEIIIHQDPEGLEEDHSVKMPD